MTAAAGYTFRGWNTQFPETMGAADVELKARWEINVHTVTFTDRGSEYSYRLEYGSQIIVPAVENYGHTLTWDPVPSETVPDDDLTYEAIWTPNVHTLRFMDGEKQVSSYTAAYGSEVRYPELNKTGYTASWDSDVGTVPDSGLSGERTPYLVDLQGLGEEQWQLTSDRARELQYLGTAGSDPEETGSGRYGGWYRLRV